MMAPTFSISIVITNCGRSAMLLQAFRSVRAARIENIVIASAPTTDEVRQAHALIRREHPATKILAFKDDPGCNATWLAGVKAATTEWVHILHDDDLILPKFRERIEATIRRKPAFILFDASAHNADGTIKAHHHKLWYRSGGSYPTDALRVALAKQPYSLSPVSGLFRREHLVNVLEEFEKNCANRREFQLSAKMHIGNDLLIWLRATELAGNFVYLNEPLVSYGNHNGSATCIDRKSKQPKLPAMYQATKKYWSASIKSPPLKVIDINEQKRRAMNETSKAMRRRHCEEAAGGFKWSEVFKGKGVDVGAGNDPIQLPNCRPFDINEGDANYLSRYVPLNSVDYLHASQILQHMNEPYAAILDWSKCLKKGGHLVVTVPDFDLFEKARWPSRFNPHHKSAWSLWRKAHPATPMFHVPTFIQTFEASGLKLVSARLIDTHYDYRSTADTDQTAGQDGAEAFIECVIRKT